MPHACPKEAGAQLQAIHGKAAYFRTQNMCTMTMCKHSYRVQLAIISNLTANSTRICMLSDRTNNFPPISGSPSALMSFEYLGRYNQVS